MPAIHTTFRELVARKGRLEGRSITYDDIQRETGLARVTITSYMLNRVKRFDEPTLITICRWLRCQPGELIVFVEGDENPEPFPHPVPSFA